MLFAGLVGLVYDVSRFTHLYNLWIKAVWTTFGCCAAAAAPIAGPPLPFATGSGSQPGMCVPPLRSAPGLLSRGGPITVLPDGVTSIGSRGGVRDDPVEDDGKMGIDL